MSDFYVLARRLTVRPLERPVTGTTRTSPFKSGWGSTVGLLASELRLHGAKAAVLEMDLRESDLRLDGLPRADRKPRSPGVVLSFKATRVPGEPHLRYEVGSYNDWRDNLRAIGLGLRALRAVDRYGVTKRGEQYAGWKQLESGASLQRGEELVRKHGDVKLAILATHPDHGGDPVDFAAIMAYRKAKAD